MAIRIGLVGTGTVGGGCIDILQKHGEAFKRHLGVEVELARVCSLSSAEAEAHGVGHLFTTDFHDITSDPTIDIVVELIGGTTIAKQVVLDAFAQGKNVVTANKALMATYGEEVMSAARAAGKEILFGASVGGGIPIIGPLKHSLIANEIESVTGIVNGTTNYMLTKMAEENVSYEQALAEAQAKGFAEADPSADVDGHDSAAKIAILASIAFNSRITINDVYTAGITSITTTDLEAAADMGYVVKLLAIAHRSPAGVDVRVHPAMLPKDHQLATVNGVFNAIYVVGDFVGEAMFFGEGAGAGAAASAVMGDVLDMARRLNAGIQPLENCSCTDKLPICPIDELSTKYYVRFTVADQPGVLAKMASAFADHNVSVYSVVQRGAKENGNVNVVYVTHTAREADIRAVIEQIANIDGLLFAEPSVIRVEE